MVIFMLIKHYVNSHSNIRIKKKLRPHQTDRTTIFCQKIKGEQEIDM